MSRLALGFALLAGLNVAVLWAVELRHRHRSKVSMLAVVGVAFLVSIALHLIAFALRGLNSPSRGGCSLCRWCGFSGVWQTSWQKLVGNDVYPIGSDPSSVALQRTPMVAPSSPPGVRTLGAADGSVLA
jgi:hypothetical protein